jgi:hypothetical protein
MNHQDNVEPPPIQWRRQKDYRDKNYHTVRKRVREFIQEFPSENPNGRDIEHPFSTAIANFLLWCCSGRDCTLGLQTVLSKDLAYIVEIYFRRYKTAAIHEGYDPEGSNGVGRKEKFKTTKSYRIVASFLVGNLGIIGADSVGAHPLLAADVEAMTLSTGVGCNGLRTLACLHALVGSDFGPRSECM